MISLHTLSDSIPLDDSVSTSSTLFRSLSDSIPLADQISTALTLFRSLSDSISLEDSVSTQRLVFMTFVEQLGLSATSAPNLAANQQLIEDGQKEVIVDPLKPDLVITNSNAALSSVIVPFAVINSTLNYSMITQTSGSTKTVTIGNSLTIIKYAKEDIYSDVQVFIPAKITISGPTSWRGIINLPNVITKPSIPTKPNTINTVTKSVEIGFGSTYLTFDKAVRITFAKEWDHHIGYFNSNTPLTEIITACNDDDPINNANNLPAEGDCKINVGSDLVVWTKHFTGFATWSSLALPPPPPPSHGSPSGSTGTGPSGAGGATGGFGGILAPYLKIEQVSYDVCNQNIVRIIVGTDNIVDPSVLLRTSIHGVIAAQLAKEQPYEQQNINATIRKLVYEAHIHSAEKSFEVVAREAIGTDLYSTGKTLEITRCQEIIDFVYEGLQPQSAQIDLSAPKIFDVKLQLGKGTKVLASDATSYANKQSMSVFAIIDSPTLIDRSELRFVKLGEDLEKFAAVKMDVVLLQVSNTTYIVSGTIPQESMQPPATQYWIDVKNNAGKTTDSEIYSIGIKPNYSINGKLELDVIQNRAAGTTARPEAYFTNEASIPVYGTISLVVDGKTVYTSPGQLFKVGQTPIILEWKTQPTDQLANHNIQAVANVYDQSFASQATVNIFSATKAIPITAPIKIESITDNNGHTIANPQILYSSFNNEGNMRYKVVAPDGTCVIGGSDKCLVTGSTFGLPGQVKSITVGDQIYRVRYSGLDSPLERFSITSIDPIIGKWNTEIDSQQELLPMAHAMQDIFLKITFRPVVTPFVTEPK